MENWKEIKDFEGYEVSDNGRVRSLSTVKGMWGKVLEPLIAGRGYFRVALRKNNKPHFKSIHRLVAEYFIPNPENKPQVNHKDGDKSNNHKDNLEWCTYRENINHAIDNGLSSVGERNGNSKLTKDQVLEIRDSRLTYKELAELYGVHKSTINRIKNNKGWKI